MPTVSVKINGTVIDKHLTAGKFPQKSRLKDYTPKVTGANIKVMDAISPVPAKNDLVELFVDGNEHYLGWIKDLERDYSDKSYLIFLHCYLHKLDEKLITYDNVHYLIGDTGNFSGAPTFTVDTGNDYLVDTGHALSSGDRIVVQSTVTLPSPLKAGHYYWVVKVDANNVNLYGNYNDYSALTNKIDITDTGTGTHSYTSNIDLDKYDDRDNEGQPNVAVSWLITQMFSDMGMTLASTSVDTQKLFNWTISAVNYTFNWQELVLDENMLYALNQPYALLYTAIDNDSEDLSFFQNKITFWTFIKYIFSCFGFNIRYTGNSTTKTFTLTGQSRNITTGAVDPGNETLYTITDNEKYNYSSKLVIGDARGYAYNGSWLDRSYYMNITKDALAEYQKTRKDDGKKTIETIKNLRIFLRDKSGGASAGDVFDTDPAVGDYDFLLGNLLMNKINALQFNFQKEEIESPIKLSNHTIKEEIVDVEKMRSNILQEDNLLLSE